MSSKLKDAVDKLRGEKAVAKPKEETAPVVLPAMDMDADDIIRDSCGEAAMQLATEMKTAKSASDRIKAATEILNRGKGRPVERKVNIDIEIGDMNDAQRQAKIKELMYALGLETRTGNAAALFVGRKGASGSKQVEES